jgi:predicted CXXCH cytochrome family protein
MLALGLLLLVSPTATRAQDEEEERFYVGEGECSDCHRQLARDHEGQPHALAMFNVERNEEALLADFSAGEDVRTVQFPGEDAPRPFTLDDVRYALGSGRYVQRFLYEAEDDIYWVFPAEWNVLTGQWQPFTLAEDWNGDAYSFNQQCAACHTTGFDASQLEWEDNGVTCEACHGPGSLHTEVGGDIRDIPDDNDRRDLEASISLALDAQTCGQCHSRGTTADGQPYPAGYRPGALLADAGGYTLVASDDPLHWWQTGHASQANMQYNEWSQSGHGSAFNTMQSADDFQIGCLACHNVSFNRAANMLAKIELEDDRDRLEVLFYDELDLDVDDVNDLPYAELLDATIAEMELDPALFNRDALVLPQLLPYFLQRLHEEGDLEDTGVLLQQLEAIISAAESDTPIDHAELALGVTCTSCHNPHAGGEEPIVPTIDDYQLCTSCHQSAPATAGLHHPVRELFEGATLVSEVPGVASAHYSAAEGPRCATCHLPEVPVESASRASHTFMPVLPGAAIDQQTVQDSCSGCHSEQTDAASMQSLIDSIQSSTETRMQAIEAALSADTPQWVTDALAAVSGDGSKGIHNYSYVNNLLGAAEIQLGLAPASAELVLPDVQPIAADTQAVSAPTTSSGGLTMPGIVLLAICGLIIGGAAYAFFIREKSDEQA